MSETDEYIEANLPIAVDFVERVGAAALVGSFEQADLLVEGIQHDFERIAAGDPMPALGEGMVCEYCAARGLCRKDFWA